MKFIKGLFKKKCKHLSKNIVDQWYADGTTRWKITCTDCGNITHTDRTRD